MASYGSVTLWICCGCSTRRIARAVDGTAAQGDAGGAGGGAVSPSAGPGGRGVAVLGGALVGAI